MGRTRVEKGGRLGRVKNFYSIRALVPKQAMPPSKVARLLRKVSVTFTVADNHPFPFS